MAVLWFTAVFLIFCNCVARGAETADARVLRLAMTITVIADFNLIFVKNPLYGLCAFCCVQMIYCYRYGGKRLCTALAVLWAALLPVLLQLFGAVIAAGALYAVSFALSLSAAALTAKKKYPHPNSLFVVWGMGLFACCDVCVAFNYFFPGSAYPLMWVFYLPGQALLSMSGIRPQSVDGY